MASSTRSAGISNSEPGTSCIFIWPVAGSFFHSTRHATSALYLAVLAPEHLGAYRPVAVGTFLVRRGSAQLGRPIGPHRIVLDVRRLRQQLELADGLGAMPVGGAHAIRAGVAAADDNHVLAGGPQVGERCRLRPRACSATAGTPSRNGSRPARGPGWAGRGDARRRPKRPRRRTRPAAVSPG